MLTLFFGNFRTRPISLHDAYNRNNKCKTTPLSRPSHGDPPSPTFSRLAPLPFCPLFCSPRYTILYRLRTLRTLGLSQPLATTHTHSQHHFTRPHPLYALTPSPNPSFAVYYNFEELLQQLSDRPSAIRSSVNGIQQQRLGDKHLATQSQVDTLSGLLKDFIGQVNTQFDVCMLATSPNAHRQELINKMNGKFYAPRLAQSSPLIVCAISIIFFLIIFNRICFTYG